MDTAFEYVFPAIRGIQAHREYYISMCPLRLIPKIFIFDEDELLPELRAQRSLNKGRVPEIARYITRNRDSYVFSAITASVDADVRFAPLSMAQESKRVGLLHIPMDARFIINDGQHRRAAIEMALHDNPELGDESIAVVLFLDKGLERCQQMFADLNRYAIRPSKSLGVLYDHRDDTASLAKLVVIKSAFFCDVVEMERSTLSQRSRKLFTLSAIYTATSALLNNVERKTSEDLANTAAAYWEEVAKHFKEWQFVKENKISAGEIRRDFIHAHGIALHAIGKVGNQLLQKHPQSWQAKLKALKTVNWSRSNAMAWEGRAMIGGRISKATQNVILTTNIIKKHLNMPLSPEEQRIEDAFSRGKHEKK